MSGSAIQNFVNKYLGEAESVSASTGLPVDYILGQAGLESGWGTSNAAQQGNNFFGISPGGSLASYSSPSAGFSAYGNLVNSQYSGVTSTDMTPQAIGDYMQEAGYSGTQGYGSSVAGATAAVDQAMGGAPPTPATTTAGTPTTAPGTTQGGSITSPSTWVSALGSWLGSYATRGALILLAIILLIGGTYLFASRTQAVSDAT